MALNIYWKFQGFVFLFFELDEFSIFETWLKEVWKRANVERIMGKVITEQDRTGNE